MTQATFDDVYAEVQRVNKRLDSLERAVRELMTMILPECELSEGEWAELKAIEAEMDDGNYLTIDELKQKYGAS
jgi:hypothetical protein